jgi:hypothetical protein
LEALIGYAVAGTGKVAVQSTTTNVKTPTDILVPLKSGFFLSAGAGFKKQFKDKLFFVGSVRTVVIFGSLYGGTDFADRFYYNIPFLFNLGLEYAF